MRETAPVRTATKPEWIARRTAVRERLLRALGLDPLPDRLPGELHTSGTLEREGYRVHRVYWQTWPKVWASGWLYAPAETASPGPAVLYPLSAGGLDAEAQARLAALALLGYTALAIDPLEVRELAVGLTRATVSTYTGMRAFDLLAALPEVDREKIGLAAPAGAAEEARYLLAAEERLRAAVIPEAALVPFHALPEPIPVPGVLPFTDPVELCALASPRALLILGTADSAGRDTEEERNRLLSIFRLWGQPDRLAYRQLSSADAPEVIAAWLERELRRDRSAEPRPLGETPIESAETLAELEGAPEGDRGVEGILDWHRRRVVAQPPQLEGKPARRSYQERTRAELRALLGEPCRVTLDPRSDGEIEGAARLTLRSERDVRVPVLWRHEGGEGLRPVVVVAHPEGKEAALRQPAAAGLAAAGWSLLAPDLRLCGELSREWRDGPALWGRPAVGMAVDDLLACVDWLHGHPEVDPASIVLLGCEGHGVVTLLAGGLDERVGAVVADCCGTTYRDGGEGLPVIPNLLRVADLPQIASTVSPRPLWLYRVPAERVGFSSRRYYDWTRRTHQSIGEEESLQLDTGELPEASRLDEWLRRRLRRARRGG
ncbi:MAG: hypothetical protein ACK47B_29120 [Armatimonadota bacterium]